MFKGRENGSSLTAKLLWENSNKNPTTFTSEKVTLNDKLLDYSYLVFKTKSVYGDTYYRDLIVKVEPINKTTSDTYSDYAEFQPLSDSIYNSSISYKNVIGVGRRLSAIKNEPYSLDIGVCRSMGYQEEQNSFVMPLKIYGIKGEINGIK